jgi:hypothetical protein
MPQCVQLGEVGVHRGRVDDQQPRLGAAAVPEGVCAVPRGTSAKARGPSRCSTPSISTVTAPSRTKYASEQFVCRCAGGRRPRAGSVRSISEKSPSSRAAVALKNISLPRAEYVCTASPSARTSAIARWSFDSDDASSPDADPTDSVTVRDSSRAGRAILPLTDRPVDRRRVWRWDRVRVLLECGLLSRSAQGGAAVRRRGGVPTRGGSRRRSVDRR